MSGILGLLGALTGIAGAGGSIYSNIQANETNKEINEQNREAEFGMLHQMNNFNAGQAILADQRARALYSDLQSPAAIKQQLQDAGLSVGLMYSGSGMGGSMQSGAQASSSSSPNFGRIAANPVLDAQTAALLANAAKTAAETENIKSKTRLNEKDLSVRDQMILESQKLMEKYTQDITESENRVNLLVEEKLTEISKRGNIEEDTNLKKEKQELLKAQADYQKSLKALTDINALYAGRLNEAKISEMRSHAKEMMASAKKIGLETDVLERTKENLIKKIAAEVAYAEFKSGKDYTDKEMEYLTEQINSLQLKSWGEQQRKHFYEAFNRSGNGSGDFLRILFEDLFPL